MKKPTKAIAADPDWPSGYGVVVAAEGVWTGSGFSQRMADAVRYRPCTDDYLDGIRAAAGAGGSDCCLCYVPGTL